MAVYVLVHGGWAWRPVARLLQAAGHEVFTPTLTGSGERVHLTSPDIGLDTHIEDVANVLRYEDHSGAVLVGFSYGGIVISGVAERVPERLGHLVYLDAFAPEDGQSVADLVGPEVTGFIDALAFSQRDGWRVPHTPPDAERRTDLLLEPTRQPLRLASPEAARLPRT